MKPSVELARWVVLMVVLGTPVPAALQFVPEEQRFAPGLDAEAISASFPFSTLGPGTIEGISVTSACGCTTAELATPVRPRYLPAQPAPIILAFPLSSPRAP